MQCESCQQNEATVHVTQIVDGKVTKFHLCEACAKAKGVELHAQPMDIGGMLESLKEQLSHLKGDLEAEPARPAACPVCGMTRTEILKKGRMGCDQCYETFASEMLPVVVSLQHCDQHLGKVPRRASERMRHSVELARWKRELEQAVAGENYELAARLRDRIKAVTAEGAGA